MNSLADTHTGSGWKDDDFQQPKTEQDEPSKVYPLVSIGIPVYNGEKYAAEAIRSAQAQDYPNLEIIISDNASTDSTPVIIKTLADEDPRIRVIWQETNVGAAANFNAVLDESKGEYTMWLAADDLIEPSYIRRSVEILSTRPEVIGVYSNARRIDDSGDQVGDYETSMSALRLDHPDAAVRARDAIKGFPAVAVFGVMRRDAMMATGKHGDYIGGDRVLVMELALLGQLVRIDEELFARRIHPDAYSSLVEKGARARWFGGADANPGNADIVRIRKHLDGLRSLAPDSRVRRQGSIAVLTWLPWTLAKSHSFNAVQRVLMLVGKEIDRTKFEA